MDHATGWLLGSATLLLTAAMALEAPGGGQGPVAGKPPSQRSAFVPAEADGATARAVAAAKALLDSLDDATRARVRGDFGDERRRAQWSNLPTGIFERAGLRFGDATEAQRARVIELLGALLSEKGVRQVIENMNGDEVLAGPRRGQVVFGKDEYYLSILGEPRLDAPWIVQFGGHHLALNVTVAGAHVVLTPSLTGGQPIRYTLDGEEVVQLEDETKRAFALLHALDDSQRATAVRGERFIDLTWGPGRERSVRRPEGLRGDAMTLAQRGLFLDLIAERVGLVEATSAARRLAEIRARLDETTFAWYGPSEPESAVYYRIEGPTLFIEHSPQGNGPAAREHVHAMYRDPTNEYGAAVDGK